MIEVENTEAEGEEEEVIRIGWYDECEKKWILVGIYTNLRRKYEGLTHSGFDYTFLYGNEQINSSARVCEIIANHC